MDSILRILSLDGLHPALAAIVIVFYVTFALWIVFGVVVARTRRRIGATNLDRIPIPATPPRPEFTVENRKEKDEVAARAAKYVPPSAAGVFATTAPAARGGSMGALSRVAGLLALLLGLGFIGLLVYALVVKPSATPLEFFSNDAWKMLLATHWTVIVLTAIRVGVLIFGVRDLMHQKTKEA